LIAFDFVTVFTGGRFVTPSRFDENGVRNICLSSKILELTTRKMLGLNNKQFIVDTPMIRIEFVGLNVELRDGFGQLVRKGVVRIKNPKPFGIGTVHFFDVTHT
jgi:hypothetical protein